MCLPATLEIEFLLLDRSHVETHFSSESLLMQTPYIGRHVNFPDTPITPLHLILIRLIKNKYSKPSLEFSLLSSCYNFNRRNEFCGVSFLYLKRQLSCLVFTAMSIFVDINIFKFGIFDMSELSFYSLTSFFRRMKFL
jgi:hypothetical protein